MQSSADASKLLVTEKRRKVNDADISAYLSMKIQLGRMVSLIKEGKLDELEDTELESIQNKLKYSKFKNNQNLELESLKYSRFSQESSGFDASINAKLISYIDKESGKNTSLLKKIDMTKDLLEKRKKINLTIEQYLKTARLIKMTRKELNELFGAELDINVLVKSGRLIKLNGEDPSLTEYEFNMTNNLMFQKSLEELRQSIDVKIATCDKVRVEIKEKKDKWEKASTKLLDLISEIETEIDLD